MATKKEKRERALAKRERFLEEYREAGLKAQRESQAEWVNRRAETDRRIAELNRDGDRALAIAIAIHARL